MCEIGKVLVADDHELVIKGICNILNEKFKIGEIKEFTDPELVLGEIKKGPFDLYILDIEFEGMSGFDLITQIREMHHDAKIIVITMHDELWNVKHLLSLNVDGILLKKSSGIYLETAVKAVINNEIFLCPIFTKLKKRNMVYIKKQKNDNCAPTQAELVVLKHIVQGFSSKEISEALGVSENTIEAHRKNLFVKLEARNVAHLVSIAIRHHLVEV